MKAPRRWTKFDDDTLKVLARKNDIRKIALLMDRTENAVQARLHVIDVKAKRANGWEDSELEWLENNFKKKSLDEISAHLNRATCVVSRKCREMGLYKRPPRGHYSRKAKAEDEHYVRFKRDL